MSIGKRLIDLARAELNSLLERAARTDDDEPERAHDRWDGASELNEVTDAELEAEMERRRRAREEVDEATRRPRPGPTPYRERFRPEPPRRTAAGDEAIRQAYANLEVPPGADFDTVRKAYRRLMRKYHPDLHASSPDQQKTANDLAQRLTNAYKLLEKHLRR
jgi:DnaJ-domain-containing protein 1